VSAHDDPAMLDAQRRAKQAKRVPYVYRPDSMFTPSEQWDQRVRETLRLAEAGELLTGNAVAAIGGLNAAYHGLELVKAQAVPGKIVIYQQIEDLPITRLNELKDTLPTVAALLRDGKYWTKAAEEELLRLKLP